MLELDVSVERRDLVVEVALVVRPGERVALFGPSGAGKTTVLEAVAGFVAPRSGTVRLAGRTLATGSPRRSVPVWLRRVGLVRQDPSLFPHLDVAGNLAYARPVRRAATAAGRWGIREVERTAEMLGIGGLMGARPGELSGGEARRVAIARTLLCDVEALLLDEPYTGLDARTRRSVTDVVSGAVTARGLPSVLVAHELSEAQAFADRLGLLDAGRVLQLGDPHEVVARPASRRAAELVGYGAFLPDGRGGTIGVHPARVVVGAHPDAGVVLDGPVRDVRASGARFEVDLEARGTTVTCELDGAPATGLVEVTAVDPPRFAPDGSARR
ncbi:MAG: ATP-binding cassette domain-containing protein [Actinomycetota bacterium]|nr:ATP-binding cassette domain-containing protein [Actinomycetota bacterium]